MNRRPPEQILVVDDDSEQCRMFCRYFEKQGFRCFSATCADEARKKAQTLQPDVILIDIGMPGTDGATLCKQLRLDGRTEGIPLMLMTGLRFPTGILTAAAEKLATGPIYFKGVDLGILLSRVQRLLQFPVISKSSKKFFIDPVSQTIWIKTRRVPALPPRRFQLLSALLSSERLCTREELLERVWSVRDNLKIVDVNIFRLRRDLRDFHDVDINTMVGGYWLRIR